MVELLFALAAIVPAYLLGRRGSPPGASRWSACLSAAAAGLAVGLLPAAVSRPFLKQFTRELLVALVLVLLLARAEAAFTPARLAVLAAACVPAALLSNTSLFVTAAAVAALGLRVLLKAEWRRLTGVLAAIGAVVLWRAGYAAVALTLPLLGVELVIAGATRRFPFAEERTSLFALGLVAAFCGIGVGAVAARPRNRVPPLGVLWLVGALALLVPAAVAAGAIRIPNELVPQQLAHIQSQRRTGDVVLVSAFASFQYAYYAPDRPTFVGKPPRWGAVPFTVTYPGRTDLLVVGGLDRAAIRRALADAAGRTRRIWVVLGHSEPRRGEEARWHAAARSIGRVTKVRTGIVERFGPRRAELERPWIVEVGRRTAPG